MLALYPRIDAVVESEGALVIDSPAFNGELASAFFAWLDERILKPDTLAALQEVLPGLPDDHLLDVAATVARSARRP